MKVLINKENTLKKPTDIDKDLVKEFKIPESAELDKEFKVAFIKQQVEEFKKIIWRHRVDIVLSQKLVDSENETLQTKGRENLLTYRNTVKQMVGAIEVLEDFLKELEG